MNVGAILWLFAIGGFWPGGHYEALAYRDMPACEHDRPRIVSLTRAHGYEGVTTMCREVRRRAI